MDDDELDPVKIGAKLGWSQAQIDALTACLKEQKPLWLPMYSGWVPSNASSRPPVLGEGGKGLGQRVETALSNLTLLRRLSPRRPAHAYIGSTEWPARRANFVRRQIIRWL
jgi:hypothetical protein